MLLDKVGQEISPGCIIAYGSGRGELSIGKVVSIGRKIDTRWGLNNERDKITVRALHIGYSGGLKLAEKNSVLQYPNRIVVLDSSKVEPEYMELFNKVPTDG